MDWGESRGRKGGERERESERGCSLRGIFAGEFFRGVDGRRYVTAVTEIRDRIRKAAAAAVFDSAKFIE